MKEWHLINHFILISVLLFTSKFIKEKLPFFKKIVIPTALIAGFMGLFLSDQFLGLITVDRHFLEEIIYHTMALGFIALSLKSTSSSINKNSWTTGAIIIMTYLIQGILGFSIIYTLYKTIKPGIFPGAGLLLPLGFGQGPGYAFSIGKSWSDYLVNGGRLGLTIATVGFLWGGIFGVIILNYYIKKNNIKLKRQNESGSVIKEKYEFETIKEIRFFDSLTTQITIILIIYAFVFLTISLTQTYLPKLGEIGNTLAGLFHGFHFLFGILYSILFKKIQTKLYKKGFETKFITNDYLLSNITSFMFNIMIVCSVLAITNNTVIEYALEILLITTFGGIVTFIFLNYICKRLYNKNVLEYLIALYGMLTGTASTGIALLKGIDPDLETEVAGNMVAGSATAAAMALPMFLMLTLPVIALTTNNEAFYIYTIVSMSAYLLLILGVFLKLNKKK